MCGRAAIPVSRTSSRRATDTYQVTTDMARHGLSKGVLFFPWQPWMPATWSQVYGFVEGTGRLWLVGVDLAGLVSRDEDRRTGALTAFREKHCRRDSAGRSRLEPGRASSSDP
jgi:hypothetical protein